MAMFSRASTQTMLSAVLLAIVMPAAAQRGPATIARDLTPPACPQRLTTQQSAAVEDGWEIHRGSSVHRLTAITFFDGPTPGLAQLIETGSRRVRGTEVSTWTFEGPGGPYYMACMYHGTDLIVSRPLPREVRQCSVTTDLRNRTVPDRVRCS